MFLASLFATISRPKRPELPITFNDLFALKRALLSGQGFAANEFVYFSDRNETDAKRVFDFLSAKHKAFRFGSFVKAFNPRFMRSAGILSRIASETTETWCKSDVQIAQTAYGETPKFSFYKSYGGPRPRLGLDSMMEDLTVALERGNTHVRYDLWIHNPQHNAGLREIFDLKPAFDRAKNDATLKIAAKQNWDEPTLLAVVDLLRNHGFRGSAIYEFISPSAGDALKVMEKNGKFNEARIQL